MYLYLQSYISIQGDKKRVLPHAESPSFPQPGFLSAHALHHFYLKLLLLLASSVAVGTKASISTCWPIFSGSEVVPSTCQSRSLLEPETNPDDVAKS